MKRYKYFRTYHIPQSPGVTSDDRVLKNLNHFEGEEIVITEKRDGECTSIYADGYLHARSIDGNNHPSRNWIKGNIVPLIHNQVHPDIRFCGENLYAKHSIFYDDLISYFEVFSIWQAEICLSWKDTVKKCNELGLITVPILYEGKFNQKIINNIIANMDFEKQEGFVIRTKSYFLFDNSINNIAKYVRKNHVVSEDHWMHQSIIPNRLKNVV